MKTSPRSTRIGLFVRRAASTKESRRARITFLVMAVSVASGLSLLGACGGDSGPPAVTITASGPNAVSYWNEVASATVNLPGTTTGTPEEQRPSYSVDLATVHVAIYDAVMAIAGTHEPYAITPASANSGASQEAAIAAASYRVLSGLFPSRSAQYQGAYDSYLLTLPDGTAKTQGLAIGAEVAAGILALRANDGRSVVLAPYVPGTEAGQFRGVNPVNRYAPFIKPFSLVTLAQFRAPVPPALDSAVYAADVNETQSLGSATSTTRTADQGDLARFGTEPPPLYWEGNMRVFAMTNRTLAEHARLMALVWVTQADAGNACFESKYFYQRWRPLSAITLADTDGNAATVPDAAWTPVVPTPNHPEYPAAHSCVSGSMAEIINGYYGTSEVTFDIVGVNSGVTRHYTNTTSMTQEIQIARIAGGMHFRTSTVEGDALGRSVARWVLSHHFQPR
jgi:hypothetical protein